MQKLLADEAISDVPIAVVANKTDLPVRLLPSRRTLSTKLSSSQQALGRDRVISALGLEQAITAAATNPDAARPIEVFRCSLILNGGHMEALEWLAKQLA